MKQFFLACLAALTLGACGTNPTTTAPAASGASGSLQVTDAWTRPAGMGGMGDMGGEQPTTEGGMAGAQPTAAAMEGMDMGGMGNGAAYMTIRGGSEADRLIRAESDVAEVIELHTVENDGGVMKMRPVEGIDVPAGGEVQLAPGGFHVMLINLKRELKPGDTVALTLQFEKAGAVSVEASVREQ
jgi:hypothetical protein